MESLTELKLEEFGGTLFLSFLGTLLFKELEKNVSPIHAPRYA